MHLIALNRTEKVRNISTAPIRDLNGKRTSYRPSREYGNKRDSGKSGYVTFIANNSNTQSPATHSHAIEWFIDSGASAHMSFEKLWSQTPLTKTEKMNVTVGNGRAI